MMSSSVDDLMDLIYDQFEAGQPQKGKKSQRSSRIDSNSEWSIDKVATMLNLEIDDAEQIEGNLMLDIAGGHRFFAFDNHTIEQLPKMIRHAVSSLRDGERFNYTKMYNQQVVKIGFPTSMGLPFVFSLQVPTLVYVGGEARLKTHPDLSTGSSDQILLPQTLNLTTDLKITYSSKVQSKLGFITPFSHQRYLAGYDSNIQVVLPIRSKIDVDVENMNVTAKIQPLYPNKYQKLVEYSTMAYTTQHDILDLSPVQTDKNAQILHIRPIKRMQTTVGQQNTGFAFDLKAETEQKFFDWAYFFNGIQRHDLLSAILYYNKEQVIKPYTNYTLSYNPSKTTAKTARLTFNYDDKQDYQNSDREERQQNSAIPSTTSPDSQKRQQQFLQRVGAGIQDSYSQVVDMSAEFEGDSKAQYVATAAYSRSPVSPKSRVLLFLSKEPAYQSNQNKPYQIAVEVKSMMPVVPLEHYRKALKADPNSTLTAYINFGEKAESGSQIKIRGHMGQTDERRQYVEQQPLSQLCEKQMQEGNNMLQACRNVTAHANYLDHYNFSIEYQKVPETFKNATYKAYAVLRHLAYPYVTENFVNASNENNKVEIDVNFAADLKSVNVSLDTPTFSSEFTSLRVHPWVEPLVVHPEYSVADRLGQKAFQAQQYPTCVIDKTYATTFDNRTYPIHIGKAWHVLVHSTPKPHYDSSSASTSSNDYEYVSVLVRDVDGGQRELMIILGEYVVYLMPTAYGPAEYFVVNGEKVKVLKDVMAHYEDKRGNTIVQVYRLPTGAYRLYTPEHGFEVIYDGLRVKFQFPNEYRGDVRGLCGTFDGEKVTDFTSPKNCILKKPEDFVASYIIPDGSLQGTEKELRQRAQNAECYKKTIMLGDVISEREAGRQQPRSQKQQKSNYVKEGKQGSHTNYRVKVLEENGKLCFSLRPQPSCAPNSKPSKNIEQKVEFHCMEDNRAARHWVDMISKGANPDFSKKPSNLRASIKLPQSCVPQ